MDKTNDRGVCLPRASAFSPTLRIVAWSDTSSIRKKLMYGSETHLSTDTCRPSSAAAAPSDPRPLPDRCNTPVSKTCTRTPTHDISSSKSLRVRPQTIPYRSKTGSLSGRPCSAPPDHAMYQNKAPAAGGVPLSTLNLALPANVPAAKPANAFQPKLPPKKKFPPWYNPECPIRTHSISPAGVHNPGNQAGGTPSAVYHFPGADGPDFPPTRAHTEPEITRKRPEIKHRSSHQGSGPKRDLHLSHRIAHLTQQINDCKQLSRAATIVIK